jgi:hypothetical protein
LDNGSPMAEQIFHCKNLWRGEYRFFVVFAGVFVTAKQ